MSTQKICPQCQKKYATSYKFCEECGTPLIPLPPSPSSPPAHPATEIINPKDLQDALAPPPQPTPPAHPATEIITPKDLQDALAKEPTPTPPPTTPPPAPATTIITPPKLSITLTFTTNETLTLHGKLQYDVGRIDPANNWFPAVNMTSHGGEGGGVSRRHAQFSILDGQPVLIDNNSTNGTFINEQRITSPTPIKSGDTIRFGRVALTITALSWTS
ncbi:MAG TPA: FHA domain-containing protein [Anaerolineae bacterium]|nr:FHA domain-containing protein [Anaerolineae bacterium]